jgi:hypothetical protein
MLTQPKALYRADSLDENGQIQSSWIPVPENLWKYFSTRDQAVDIAANITADISPSVELIDGLGVALFIPVIYLSQDEKMWLANGTTTKPDQTARMFSEWAGWLHDRHLTTEKGEDLVAQVISTDLVELHWK